MDAIDITPAQRKELLSLLSRYLPGVPVWAFGSRVKWTSRPDSDLDLVAFSMPEQERRVSALKEALEESSLPFRIDLLVWDDIPEAFQQNIVKEYVVLVEPQVTQPIPRGGAAGEWRPQAIGKAFAVNPPRTIKRGQVTPFIPMDALPEHARTPSRVDEREFTGSGVKFQNGDTLIARITPCLENGKTAFVSGLLEGVAAHGSTEYIVLAGKPGESDDLFAYYLARSPDFRQYAIGHMEGTSGRQRVPSVAVENYTVTLPPFPEQRAIAHILGIFDDKIELNRRMNETLEAIARAIFKSWFVDFDPVRAKASGEAPESICRRLGLTPDLLALFPDRLVDSELGGIPEGWEQKRVDDLMEFAYGKALKASDRIDGSVPVYGSGGVTGFHNEHLVDGPGIIVGRKGTVGSLYWEDRPFYPIDTVFYVIPKVERTFCFYLLQTLGLVRMNTDAAVPGLNRNNVYRLPVTWAPSELRLAFDRVAKPLRSRKFSNDQESETLATIRDALLPKLLSGELRVKDDKTDVGMKEAAHG